jgi:hypothetical protein
MLAMGLIQDMTGLAGHRSGLEVLVAFDALIVKRVGSFQHLRVLHIFGIMAIQTCVRQAIGFLGDVVAGAAGNEGGVVIHGMAVAGIAGKAIVHIRCVGLMVEKNFSGGHLEHHSHRFFRGFFRERCITQYTYQQEIYDQPVDYFQLFLG